MKNYSKLRSLFALGFPIFLAGLFCIMIVLFNQYQQKLRQFEIMQNWLDQAKVIISSITSSYQIEDWLEKELRPLFSNEPA